MPACSTWRVSHSCFTKYRVAQHCCGPWRVVEPFACQGVALVFAALGRAVFLAFFRRWRRFVVGFAQHGHEKSLAVHAVRHEAIDAVRRVDARCDAPCFDGRHSHGLRAVLVHEVVHHFFVLGAVVGASAVDEQPAGSQCRPHVVHDGALARGALVNEFGCPLLHGLRVLAHHPLAAARHVGSHHVEGVDESSQLCRGVAGDHGVGIAPARHVVGKGARTAAHNLVGHHHRALWQRTQRRRSLAAGSGAQVEVTHGSVYQALDDVVDKHRRGVLHIVGAAMQHGVEGERWSLALAVMPRLAPRHLWQCRLAAVGAHRIQAHRHTGWRALHGPYKVVAFATQ